MIIYNIHSKTCQLYSYRRLLHLHSSPSIDSLIFLLLLPFPLPVTLSFSFSPHLFSLFISIYNHLLFFFFLSIFLFVVILVLNLKLDRLTPGSIPTPHFCFHEDPTICFHYGYCKLCVKYFVDYCYVKFLNVGFFFWCRRKTTLVILSDNWLKYLMFRSGRRFLMRPMLSHQLLLVLENLATISGMLWE